MPEIKEPKQSQSEQFKERRLRDHNSSNEAPKWFNDLINKPLTYRLRWAIQKYQTFRENKEKATSRLMFELNAYANSPNDAIDQGLVVDELPQWMKNDDGKLQVVRIRKSDGTISPMTHPVCHGDEPLRKARDEFNILTSLITDTVREANRAYPDLIAMELVLTRICDNCLRLVHKAPEWARLRWLHRCDDNYYLEGGDLAVVWYWPTVQPALLQLTINIEQCANDELKKHIFTQNDVDGSVESNDNVTFPIANHELAQLAGLKPETVSIQIHKALSTAGKATKKVGSGKALNWSKLNLHDAFHFLPDGKLKKWMIRNGLTNHIETVSNTIAHDSKE